MAAAASSLKSQPNDLVQVVSQFKLDGSQPVQRAQMTGPMPLVPAAIPSAPKQRLGKAVPVAKAVAEPKAAPPKASAKAAAKTTPAGGDEDWDTF